MGSKRKLQQVGSKPVLEWLIYLNIGKIKFCIAYNDIIHFQEVKPFTNDNGWIMRMSNDIKHWTIYISPANFSEWGDHVWDNWHFWENVYSLWK